jgi:hypothetical protein
MRSPIKRSHHKTDEHFVISVLSRVGPDPDPCLQGLDWIEKSLQGHIPIYDLDGHGMLFWSLKPFGYSGFSKKPLKIYPSNRGIPKLVKLPGLLPPALTTPV